MNFAKFVSVILIVVSYFFSQMAAARSNTLPSLSCTMIETEGARQVSSRFDVKFEKNETTAVTLFEGEMFPQMSGFATLQLRDEKFFVVLSFQEKSFSNTNARTVNEMIQNGQSTYIVTMLPSEPPNFSSLEINCIFVNKNAL